MKNSLASPAFPSCCLLPSTMNGARDLADQFISAGADVRLEMLEGGHGWAEDAADEKLSHQWLATKEPG